MLSSVPTIRRSSHAISVSRIRNTPYAPDIHAIAPRFCGPVCYLCIYDTPVSRPALVEIDTPTAAKLGFELCRMDSVAEPGDLVVLTINARDIMLLPSQARQIGGVLLKKSDRADDWQRNQHRTMQ